MSRTLLHSIQRLYTCNDAHEILRDAWILVDGRVIAAFGEGAPPPVEVRDSVDLAGCIVTPGLINVHHHFFQSITRALPFVQQSFVLEWLTRLYPLWVELRPDDLAVATQVAAAELLLSGGTTSADHSYMVPSGAFEFLEAQVAACREIGLRLHLVVGSAPTLEGDLEERLRPVLGDKLDRLVAPEARVYDLMERAARRFHDLSPRAMTRTAFGPVGVTYALPGMMEAVSRLARDHGCGLHTHLHPRPDEREKARLYGHGGPLDLLERTGWLRPGTWFAHGSQLSDDEMRRLGDAGVGVAHCAHTVPRLGFPVTRIATLRRSGVVVGIGVDGSASNDSGSLLHDLRLALILHRAGTAPGTDAETAWLSPDDALWMATRRAPGSLVATTSAESRRAARPTSPHSG
jgi:8-oxoguanine deaminase